MAGMAVRRGAPAAIVLIVAGVLGVGATPVVLGQQPTDRGGHMLGNKAATAEPQAAAALPSGFQESIALSGLIHPSVIQFAPDGRVFVAEKSGVVKVFDNLSDTTATVFTDLQAKVDDYWDRGLLGLAIPPDFPANPYIYVLYTYDAPIGGAAPVWNDACPSPPGPTTDGCVVSARLSRIAEGDVNGVQEQVLINDWCQQFPSHSIGTVAFGPDGALYVSAGDGASFTGADWGQFGGSAGSPTTKNPCGDPPTGVGGSETPPSAEGGALRSQDVRTLGGGGGSSYLASVLADSPVSYWRLDETTGTVADDLVGPNNGTYTSPYALGQAGALTGDSNPAVALSNGYVQVNSTTGIPVGPATRTVEAWFKSTVTNSYMSIVSWGTPADAQFFGVYVSPNGVILVTTGGSDRNFGSGYANGQWHHLVAVAESSTLVHVYVDGVDLGAQAIAAPMATTLNAQSVRIGASAAYPPATSPFVGSVDEVAIYNGALSASRVSAHYTAATAGSGGVSDPTTLDGAILRLDPTTGAEMAGNPLAGSSDANARRIIAHGFRNPFRFTFRPGTSELWVGDVGWNLWEELNLVSTPGTSVANYGWPCYEGTNRQATYDSIDLALCESLYSAGGVVAPYFTYNHGSTVVPGETCPTANGSSVSGLAFYQGGNYPASYAGGLFFADYSRDCIWFMPALANGRPNTASPSTFVASAVNPVDLKIGPGGDLFYADFDGGTIRRIQFTAGNQPPTASFTATPSSGSAPLTVQFNGSASSDPEGGPLTYAWDFDGNGTDDASGATTSHIYTVAGSYLARLRVTDNGALTGTKTMTIGVSSTPPVPTITAPSSSLTWAVGDTIAFSGSATDAQDGTLPASALTWAVIVHHCPTDPNNCHTHTIQTMPGVASGSFQAPDHEYPSYLELVLTATDSSGLSASTSIQLNPRTVVLSFASSPSGLTLGVGTTTGTTPFTRTVIVGSRNTLSASTPQTLAGTSYAWTSWSDGGAQSHDVIANTAGTYTATYQAQASSNQYLSAVLADTPVSYWRLGETSGTLADDLTGSNDGTYTGAYTLNQPDALVGDTNPAATFATGYVQVNSNTGIPTAASLRTVELWFKSTTNNQYMSMVSWGSSASSRFFGIYLSPNGVILTTIGGNDRNFGGGFANGQWHHLVVRTPTTTSVQLYVDGVNLGTQTISTALNTLLNNQKVRIGSSTAYPGSTSAYTGSLDEVAIYAGALSPTRIAAHYNAGITP